MNPPTKILVPSFPSMQTSHQWQSDEGLRTTLDGDGAVLASFVALCRDSDPFLQT